MRPCCFINLMTDEDLKRCKCFQRFLRGGLKGEPYHYIDCENYKFCANNNKLDVKLENRLANVVVNKNVENKIEVLSFAKTFRVKMRERGEMKNIKYKEISLTNERIKRKRLLVKFEDGYRFRKDVENGFVRLSRSKMFSSKRAKELCYSLIQNNNWKYFITLTFSNHVVNRYSDEDVKYEYQLFRKIMQYWDPNVRLLCVPEPHEDGALHFHILCCTEKDFPIVYVSEKVETWNDLGFYNNLPKSEHDKFLFPIFEKKQWKKGKFNNQMFALSFFNKGRNFTSIIDPTYENMAFNYVAKYLNKLNNIGYGKRRIYATTNLLKKTKLTLNASAYELMDLVLDYNLKIFKENEKMTVYRNFNNETCKNDKNEV